MPPRTVICQLCGGKFFAASLAHHQKVCQKKVGKQMHECPYCHSGVPLLEMDSHVLRCPAAKAAGGRPTGASAALARRLESHARGEPTPGERPLGGGGNGMGGVPELAEGDDVRVECRSCGRKFAMDRVGKHQAICEKSSAKQPRRTFKTQREYAEGGKGGSVVGVAKHMDKPTPPPVKSNWRKESAAWRDAIRSARSTPLPPWGRSAEEPRRGSQSPAARSGPRRGPSPAPRGAPAPGPAARGGAAPRGRSGGRAAAAAPARPGAPAAAGGPVGKAAGAGGFAALVVKEQFRALDANGDGRLDPQELAALLRSGDAGMSDREIGALFERIDRDRDGRIDFAEFVDFVFSDQGAAPLRAGAARGAAPRQGAAGPPAARGASRPPEWRGARGLAGRA